MENLKAELKKSRSELLTLKSWQEKRKLKKLGETNLLVLATRILGYPPFGKIHRNLEMFMEGAISQGRAIILLPRKHLKTTLITIAWTIQQLIKNPNLRFFITNERADNAKSFLREIKTQLEKNELFRELYGDWVNVKEKWTETQIIIKPRDLTAKEPTIQTGSVDTSLVSQHYDRIISDDLVSRNNTGTRDQMEKVKQYWRDLISLLEEGGFQVDIGTRWHFDDMHGWLIENNPDWPQFIRSCYNEEGVPIFPLKFTKESLARTREEIGSYDFSCLYMNNPVDDESAAFKRSQMENRFTEADLVGKKLTTFITIDNAPSSKDHTDFIGVIVNSVDREGNWYVRWVERVRGNTPTLIDKIFQLEAYWKPEMIGVEQKAFEDLIRPYIDQEMRRKNRFFSICELKDQKKRKETRIKGRLQGRFESKSIFLRKDPEDDTEKLVDELIRFPKARYDDLADALQYQQDIAYRPESEEIPSDKISEFKKRGQREPKTTRFHYNR